MASHSSGVQSVHSGSLMDITNTVGSVGLNDDAFVHAQLCETARRIKINSRSAFTKAKNLLRDLMSHNAPIEAIDENYHVFLEKLDELRSAFRNYVPFITGNILTKEEQCHLEYEFEADKMENDVDEWMHKHKQQQQATPLKQVLETDDYKPTIAQARSSCDPPMPRPEESEVDMKKEFIQLQQMIFEMNAKIAAIQDPRSSLRASAPEFTPTDQSRQPAHKQGLQPSDPKPLSTSTPQTQVHVQAQCEIEQPHPKQHATTGDASTVQQMLATFQLPQVELIKFSGDPTEYVHFLRSFEARVEVNTSDPNSRLFFLQQALDGDAKELVSGCVYMGEDGYSEALRLLKEQYGQPHIICNAFMHRFQNQPSIKSDDPRSIKRMYLLAQRCLLAMQHMSDLSVLDFPANLQSIVTKLPPYLRNKWRDFASKQQRRLQFHDMVEFLRQASLSANDPLFSNEALFGSQKKKNEKTCFTTSTETEKSHKLECFLCRGNHFISACPDFKKKRFEEKQDLVRAKKLCFRCLNYGHQAKKCKKSYVCTICRGNHMNVMHRSERRKEDVQPPVESNSEVEVQSSACQSQDQVILHAILPVKVTLNNQTATTYAFYDHGSGASFVSETLMKELKANGPEVILKLSTMHGSSPVRSNLLKKLVITDLQGDNAVTVDKAYSKECIPVTADHIPRPEELRRIPEMKKFSHLIPEYIKDLEIGLLIGANCPRALEPLNIIRREGNSAFACRLRHGWVVNGPIRAINSTPSAICHQVQIHELPVQEVFFHDDFSSPASYPDEQGLSQEDKRFLAHVESGTKFKDGHYEVPLPLRDVRRKLPNNRAIAVQRNRHLQKKLSNNQKYKEQYTAFMDTLFLKGYAERVPIDQLNGEDGRLWYLPHHGVTHPKKKKLRIVFDCSATFQGISLNSCLLQGPNMTSSLVGVLSRFRTGQVCFIADIEAMFFQVSVPERDRDFFRFLWWPGGNQNGAMAEYRMKVHLFGAISSPSICNYALRRIPDDFECSDSTTETIRNHFYVDDCLKACTSTTEASTTIEELRTACKMGGFHLHKFVANDVAVLETIPRSEVAETIRDMDLKKEPLPTERTLGLQWYIESDEFGFSANEITKPATRRGLLSSISSIYDPLGIVSPFILGAKLLLQSLCASKIGWDDELPHSELQQWQIWCSHLPNIACIRVKRCLFQTPDHHSEEMHVFCDATIDGYGAVAYMRYESAVGTHCSFLMGKSRVKPLKAISIPRMELAAATVAVKMGTALCFELNYDRTKVTYHTDSTSVLYFLWNETKRFPIFVANRVQMILDFTSPEQWRYVPSSKNPADIASRGLQFSQVHGPSTETWITGPAFLHQPKSFWPEQNWNQLTDGKHATYQLNDTESAFTATVVTVKQPMDLLIEHYSDLMRLKKACSVYQMVSRILKARVKKEEIPKAELDPFTVYNLERSEEYIVKYVQKQCFKQEMESLSRTSKVAAGSSIRKLSPFVDNGFLRVGGRLSQSNLPFWTRHPILLPRKHHVTELIIAAHHQRLGHAGRNHVISSIRQHYWIVAINAAVRKHIFSCVPCRKVYHPCATQIMADLPKDRVEPAPPFTYTGVDLFGPFIIKERRSELKRYGVLFTCLVSRSIHIETANSLDTESFINALRRMISRRGMVKQMRSDRGTNLVGAEKELRRAFSEMESSPQLKQECLKNGIQWIFNTPSASHQGGVWERQIRSVRKILAGLLQPNSRQLDDEGLRTVLCEVEAIVNSRPLTTASDDPNDLVPISPNLLLTSKPTLFPPPGNFDDDANLYHRRRWKRVQALCEWFWHRWKREYLASLQERRKWTERKNPLKVGDIVLLKDENEHRGNWTMGRIMRIISERSVLIKTRSTELERPIHKLVLLYSP